MKIQLRGQSLRLRIDESELERLLGGEKLVNVTAFAAGAACRQTLRLGDGEQPRLDASAADWTLHLPRGRVSHFASSLPCREGLAFALSAGEAGVLDVALEVDVRDSIRVRRQGEYKCSADSAGVA